MSNGGQCCALEICCPPSEVRAKMPATIAKFTGCDEAVCVKFLEWMDHEGLVFAPETFRDIVRDIAAIARRHPL